MALTNENMDTADQVNYLGPGGGVFSHPGRFVNPELSGENL